MSIEKRRFIRFSLDIPITIITENGVNVPTYMRQVSIGGCLTDWEDNIFAGDQFRIEMQLPNKNKLPIAGKVIYRFAGKGIGITFTEITQFEQELIAQVISENLENEGLPVLVDPFTQPPKFVKQIADDVENEAIKSEKMLEDEQIDEAIATQNELCDAP
jgi:Tfp pilus assembly protein PilZ